MKIFDCFMLFDEEMLLDIRLNYLNNYVDKFIIVESTYTHSGEKKKLVFEHKNFHQFQDNINYIIVDNEPEGIEKISKEDTEHKKNQKYILNALKRENYQRNCINQGLTSAELNDWVIVSDIDEIPNLENTNLMSIKKKLIFFKQKIFYYKFNLLLESFDWYGSKACKKNDLISPQWLRNIKDKNYPLWRVDTLFSKTKYKNIHFVDNGGWHFSYMKKARDIEKKLKSYLHHREYDIEPVGINKIEEFIKNKKTIYDLKTDMKKSKFNKGQELKIMDTKYLPSYIQKNADKYKEWFA